VRIRNSELSVQKRSRGKPPLGKNPGRIVLRKLYINEERSIRESAGLQGYTKDMVTRVLNEYGIEARTNENRSKLLTVSLGDLEAAIGDKGIRVTAGELGIAEANLHTWQYAFAAHFIRGTRDMRALQLIFGYKSIKTTQIYAHMSNQHLSKLVNQIPGPKMDTILGTPVVLPGPGFRKSLIGKWWAIEDLNL
jgi:integrase